MDSSLADLGLVMLTASVTAAVPHNEDTETAANTSVNVTAQADNCAISTNLAELEARAMALEPPTFLLQTAVPSAFHPPDGSTLCIDDAVARVGERGMRWDYLGGLRLQVKHLIGCYPYLPSRVRPLRSGLARPDRLCAAQDGVHDTGQLSVTDGGDAAEVIVVCRDGLPNELRLSPA